jgi:hypothetical protein
MPETTHYESIGVEGNGIRIRGCPRCGSPIVIPYSLKRATFGECPDSDCEAWVTYNVSVTAVAFDDRESAKYHFETYIEED